jgi:hypothetical protein
MTSRRAYSRSLNTNFTLCIFEEDYIRIGKFVSKIPHAETGGNLFGLWTNHGNAVVLVATGPGQNCTRNSVSFYQDIPYMKHVGDLLTSQFPLCHIGEWHSHHQMQLFEPSGGDCSTVRRNYPTGSQGFVLMIANIQHDGNVKLSPYKFMDERSPYEYGKIEVLRVENPFMKAEVILRYIEEGKERKIRDTEMSGRLIERERQSRPTTRDSACLPARGNEHDETHKLSIRNRSHQDRYLNDRSRNDRRLHDRSRSRSPLKKTNSSPSPPTEAQTESQRKRQEDAHQLRRLPRPPSQQKSSIRHQMRNGVFHAPVLSQNTVSIAPADRHEMTTATITPGHRGCSHVQASEVQNHNQTPQWYEKHPDILKAIFDFVTSLSDVNITVNMTRDILTKNITMEFTHHCYKWAVDFPAHFPQGSVKLKKTLSCSESYAYPYDVKGLGDVDRFKTTLKSTLQDNCTNCKTEQILQQSRRYSNRHYK